jgi:hypothetical protein
MNSAFHLQVYLDPNPALDSGSYWTVGNILLQNDKGKFSTKTSRKNHLHSIACENISPKIFKIY